MNSTTTLFEILALGFILSADSFSAALAMGFRPFTRRKALYFALTSSLTEGFVTWIGAISGAEIVKRFSAYDHWVAFILLASVALHMVLESLRDIRSQKKGISDPNQRPPHGRLKIALVSLATSLDGLGVGVSLGVLGKPMGWILVSVIVWAFLGTLVGLKLAKKLSFKFGSTLNLLSALILLALAVKLLEI
jgi:putative Mn2+ efflux pump MntP